MRHQATVSGIAGLVTGSAAGFIGVGGGEFRIPVLIRVLGFSLHAAAGVNLIVGLFTVAVGAYRRLGQAAISEDAMRLAAVMGLASIAGAAVGVISRKRLHVVLLGTIVQAYLVVAGIWMLYESVAHAEHVLTNPAGALRWMVAGGIAFIIAAISGVLGIAGGEMRIPALLYLFGMPIVQAGTLSLLVSIPTLGTGVVADRRLGGIPNAVLPLAAIMGIASAVGVAIGAAAVPYASRDILKAVLGLVLLLSAFRLSPKREHERGISEARLSHK